MLLRSWKTSLFLVACLSVKGWGALNQTYPTDPNTTVRWDTYLDALETIANSTFTAPVAQQFTPPQVSTSVPTFAAFTYPQTVIPSTTSFVYFETAAVIGMNVATLIPGTTNFAISSKVFNMMDVLGQIERDAKNQAIIDIANKDMQEYMIDGDTNPVDYPPIDGYTHLPGWNGWCAKVVGGSLIAVACPPPGQ